MKKTFTITAPKLKPRQPFAPPRRVVPAKKGRAPYRRGKNKETDRDK